MPSLAAQKFYDATKRVGYFQKIPSDKRIRPLARIEAETYYHAALAAYVAAWEAYLEQLVREFYSTIAKPTVLDFNAIHQIARERVERKNGILDKFNTPNFENSRVLLTENTGYDPHSKWNWPHRSMPVLKVQELLNEILKVRHSFAHGYAMPQYSWNTLPSGQCRLTRKAIDMVEACFKNLVTRTDAGMKDHIQKIYSIPLTW